METFDPPLDARKREVYDPKAQNEFINAVCYGTYEELEQVLKTQKENIDINQRDTIGRTLLHEFLGGPGLTAEQEKKVKLLIDHADLTATDDRGRNLVHEAIYTDKLELMRYLLKRLEAQNPTQVKAILNQAEKNSVSRTPFVRAVSKNNRELVELLLQKGAEPTIEDLIEAMNSSIERYSLAMLQYLVDEVIKSKRKMLAEEDVFPVLVQAAQRSHSDMSDIVKYLIEKFDKRCFLVCAKDGAGNTALHYAAMENNRPTMEVLIMKGASVDKPNNDGQTPMHLAAKQGCDSSVNTLLSKNRAAIDIQDQAGQTALHLAAQQGHQRVVRVLLARGANKNLVNQAGQTPLAVAYQAHQLAAKQGDENTMQNLDDIIAELSKGS